MAKQQSSEMKYADFAQILQILQQSSELKRCTKKQQRPTAWTTSRLIEGEAVQSAHLFFQQQLAVAHTTLKLPVHRLCKTIGQSLALLLPLGFDCRLLTADFFLFVG